MNFRLMSIYYKESIIIFPQTMESIRTDQTFNLMKLFFLVEDGVLSDHLYSAINY